MKLLTMALLSATYLATFGTARAQTEDPILARIDKARQAYDKSEDNFRKGVLAKINAAEERAVKAGKKAAVDQAVAEREAFEATGALPKSISVNDLLSQRNQARIDLQAAFARGIAELTKSRRTAEADALEREAIAFKSKFAGDLIKPGSIWRGEKRYIRGGPSGTHPFELRVTDRSGDIFKGQIFEDAMSHDIEGSIKGDVVEWKNTRIRTGAYPGQSQTGTFEGEVMKLHFFRASGGGGLPVEAEGTIKLLNSKKK